MYYLLATREVGPNRIRLIIVMSLYRPASYLFLKFFPLQEIHSLDVYLIGVGADRGREFVSKSEASRVEAG